MAHLSEIANNEAIICIEFLLAIILPPLSVFLKFGLKCEFWFCLLLTLLGWVPGMLYAIYAVNK